MQLQNHFSMHPINHQIIILDDHPLVAQGLAQYVCSVRPEFEVLIAHHYAELQKIIDSKTCPQLVIADVWLDGGNLLSDVGRFKKCCPQTPWLAISGDDDPSIAQRMRLAGAHGFFHKRTAPEKFALALEAVLSGGYWFESMDGVNPVQQSAHDWIVTPSELGLTPRQGEILDLVLRGLPNKRIAIMLSISESTVKEHVTGILEKLGVRNRVEAITHLRGRRMRLSGGK